MKSILVAIQFLTIVPVARKMEVTEADMARSVAAFPLAGLFQGAALVAMAYLAGLVLPTGLVAAMVLLVHVVLNGAFHLDGLSDTFDAIAKRGDREGKLAAMKDGRSGAAGVSALVLSVLLKYLLIMTVAGLYPYSINFTLLMMPVFSRWAMASAMLHGSPARPEGLGKIFIEGTGVREFTVATLTVFVIMTLAAVYLGELVAHKHLLNAISIVLLYAFTLLMLRLFKGQFGGLTGDTLGALGELSENVFLLSVVVWSGFYI
jgi:adenosylcobinamide-GDP ribazoletransferase